MRRGIWAESPCGHRLPSSPPLPLKVGRIATSGGRGWTPHFKKRPGRPSLGPGAQGPSTVAQQPTVRGAGYGRTRSACGASAKPLHFSEPQAPHL